MHIWCTEMLHHITVANITTWLSCFDLVTLSIDIGASMLEWKVRRHGVQTREAPYIIAQHCCCIHMFLVKCTASLHHHMKSRKTSVKCSVFTSPAKISEFNISVQYTKSEYYRITEPASYRHWINFQLELCADGFFWAMALAPLNARRQWHHVDPILSAQQVRKCQYTERLTDYEYREMLHHEKLK